MRRMKEKMGKITGGQGEKLAEKRREGRGRGKQQDGNREGEVGK